MKITLSIILIYLFAIHSARSDEIDIKTRMSPEDWKNSGLEKLSPEELKHLNNWIDSRIERKNDPDYPASKLSRKEAEQILLGPIETHIEGRFSGWTGKTKFQLANGEIWQQRKSGWYKVDIESPKIIIKKNTFGFYDMEIVETGKKIGVTRLK